MLILCVAAWCLSVSLPSVRMGHFANHYYRSDSGGRAKSAQNHRPESFHAWKSRLAKLFGSGTPDDIKEAQSLEDSDFNRFHKTVALWEPLIGSRGDWTRLLRRERAMATTAVATNLQSMPTKWADWRELGPTTRPIVGSTASAAGTGQVNFISFDPRDENHIFTGSAACGLFRSTDGGMNWQPAGTDFFPGPSAGDCAVSPTNSSVWFLATGYAECNPQDPIEAFQWRQSYGIYRTVDAGANWTAVGDFGSMAPPPDWWGYGIHKLVFDPNNPNVLYAATTMGLWKTTSALAANPTWSRLPIGGNDDSDVYDITFRPNTSTLYITTAQRAPLGTRVLVSTNGGASWTDVLGSQSFISNETDRLSLAVTPADPTLLYVAKVYAHYPQTTVTTSGTGTTIPVADAREIYVGNQVMVGSVGPRVVTAVTTGISPSVSVAGNPLAFAAAAPIVVRTPRTRLYRYDGANWTYKGPISNTGSWNPVAQGISISRASSLSVSTIDPLRVYAGDIHEVVTADASGNGMCTWSVLSSGVHDDIHRVRMSPSGKLYAATHGGIYKSVNGGTTWFPASNGLSVATVQSLACAATEPNFIATGNFDTSTNLYNGLTGAWRTVYGGDGCTARIASGNPLLVVGSSQWGSAYISTNGGLTSSGSLWWPSAWFTQFALDVSSSPALYAAGAGPATVYKYPPPYTARTAIFNSSLLPQGYDTCIGVYTSPTSPACIYAVFHKGGSPQLIYRTLNGGTTWAPVLNPNPVAWINTIEIDEASPHRIWICYDDSTSSVHYLTFASGVWADLDLSAGLPPNTATRSLVHERGSANGIYVGTRFAGVLYRDDTLPLGTWLTYANQVPMTGLPLVEARDLEINYVDNTLRAGTFGRGVWKSRLTAPDAPVASGPDGFIRDSDSDIGAEPNTQSGSVLWDSPDIWVRNAPDHKFQAIPPRYSNEGQHQNPEYSATPLNTPWIYAKILNRGNQPLSGNILFYWADASTGLIWQTPDWKQILPTSTSDVTVTNLQPGAVAVLKTQWQSIPVPSSSTGSHYCLLARFVGAGGSDPITGEANGSVYPNVQNSNNIGWKNVTVVDLGVPGGWTTLVTVKNSGDLPKSTRLSVQSMQSDRRRRLPLSQDPFSLYSMHVSVPNQLFAKWRRRGSRRSSGVQIGRDNSIIFRRSGCWIDGLNLGPGERHTVKVRFEPLTKDNARPQGRPRLPAIIDLIQSSSEGVVGGERYYVYPSVVRRRKE